MTRREQDERILYELWRVQGLSSRHIAFRASALLECSLPQFLVMRAVSRSDGAVGPVDIAKIIGCSRANVGPVVDRLVDVGWLTKMRSPLDARMLTVRVTPQGAEGYRMLVDEVARGADSLFDLLEPEEKEQLLALLEKITGLYLD